MGSALLGHPPLRKQQQQPPTCPTPTENIRAQPKQGHFPPTTEPSVDLSRPLEQSAQLLEQQRRPEPPPSAEIMPAERESLRSILQMYGLQVPYAAGKAMTIYKNNGNRKYFDF